MSTGKNSKHKNNWELFTSFKQRGEWVELQFMAQAAKHRLAVSKPWGETQAYDVGIEHGSNFLRVQVKSASRMVGGGYICRFEPHYHKKRDYTLEQIDLFARLRDPGGRVVPDPRRQYYLGCSELAVQC